MIKTTPKKIGRAKRSVICKVCNVLKNHTHYSWYKKADTIGSTNENKSWTLNGKICKSCLSKQNCIVQKLKRSNSYPRSKKCECCGKKSEYKLNLDHSHGKSGRFRGWLCRNCNQGIGMLGDSIVGVKRALKYLQKL